MLDPLSTSSSSSSSSLGSLDSVQLISVPCNDPDDQIGMAMATRRRSIKINRDLFQHGHSLSGATTLSSPEPSPTLSDSWKSSDELVQILPGEMSHDLIKPSTFATAFWTKLKLPLYTFDQVPTFLQDNEYILTGYRMHYTYVQSWASIFFLHNESGNIWTHLLAFLVFIGLAIATPSLFYTANDLGDILVFLFFILSACHCFAFSVLFHTHYCNDRQAFVRFGCLDYAGISILICGSAVLVTYYTHYCHPWLRWVYLSLLVSISAVGIIGPMFPPWSSPHFRIWRTLIYIVSGSISGVPVMHFLILYGIPETLSFWGTYGWVFMAVTYIFGAMIYALKVPERWWPGALDVLGHSHQLWHLCVLTAALMHLFSGLELMRWRVQTTCS